MFVKARLDGEITLLLGSADICAVFHDYTMKTGCQGQVLVLGSREFKSQLEIIFSAHVAIYILVS